MKAKNRRNRIKRKRSNQKTLKNLNYEKFKNY